MKIQTDFGNAVDRILRVEIAVAGIQADHVDVVESQTNTYAIAKLQVGSRGHEIRLLPEEGTSSESIESRIRAWIANSLK